MSEVEMQFPIRLTARFLKRSYVRWLLHGWWKVLIAVSFVAVKLVPEAIRGELSGLSYVGVSALGVLALVMLGAWVRQSRFLGDWIRRQGDAPVIYTLTDEAVKSTSALGGLKLKWDVFDRLTISDFDTLLEYSWPSALTLPTDQVPAAALELMTSRMLACGKPVDDRRRSG